jgi:hypothetical protein
MGLFKHEGQGVLEEGMINDDNGVITLLQKLIRQAESAQTLGNVAEAEAFSAKVQSLLLKYRLEMTDVQIDEEQKAEPVDRESIVGRGTWQGWLVQAVADSMFCYIVANVRTFHVIGTPTNRQLCISMYTYLSANAVAAAEAHAKLWGATGSKLRTIKNNFLLGFSSAVADRLRAERKKVTDDFIETTVPVKSAAEATAPSSSTSTALLYIDRNKAAIDEYVSQAYGKLRTRSSGSSSYYHKDAYTSGKSYGGSVSLSARAGLAQA